MPQSRLVRPACVSRRSASTRLARAHRALPNLKRGSVSLPQSPSRNRRRHRKAADVQPSSSRSWPRARPNRRAAARRPFSLGPVCLRWGLFHNRAGASSPGQDPRMFRTTSSPTSSSLRRTTSRPLQPRPARPSHPRRSGLQPSAWTECCRCRLTVTRRIVLDRPPAQLGPRKPSSSTTTTSTSLSSTNKTHVSTTRSSRTSRSNLTTITRSGLRPPLLTLRLRRR